jgi:hypothetical protein
MLDDHRLKHSEMYRMNLGRYLGNCDQQTFIMSPKYFSFNNLTKKIHIQFFYILHEVDISIPIKYLFVITTC